MIDQAAAPVALRRDLVVTVTPPPTGIRAETAAARSIHPAGKPHERSLQARHFSPITIAPVFRSTDDGLDGLLISSR